MEPVPFRCGVLHRPAQAGGVRAFNRDELPLPECGADLLRCDTLNEPPIPRRIEGQQQHIGPAGCGKCCHTAAFRGLLLRIEPLKTANIDEQIEYAQSDRDAIGCITHHVPHLCGALIAGGLDCLRYDIDADGFPAVPGEFSSELSATTAQI